jgi:hypothetical protein
MYIYCDDANKFTGKFFEYYCAGDSIELACAKAAEECGVNSGISSYVIES